MGKQTRVLCVREVQTSIKDSVHALLSQLIMEMDLKGFTITEVDIKHDNGSYIAFRGMKDHTSDAIKSMEGFDIAWVEEAQALRQRSFDVLYPTIRKTNSELWFSWNPRYAEDPVDAFFRNNPSDPDVICVTSNWRDNPWISEVLVKDKDRDFKNDPIAAMHIWEGQYMQVTAGAYYAKDLVRTHLEGRIRHVPYDRAANVYAGFDLGIGDKTAVWLFQVINQEWHWLAYYEAAGMPLGHYIDWLRARPYKIDTVLLPHDAEARELQTGKNRKQFFEERGYHARVVPKGAVEDGIEAVRQILNRCYFDAEETAEGLHMLRSYRTDYRENLRTFAPQPLHDFASHGADAFRTSVMGATLVDYVRSDWSKPIIRGLQVVA
jgi:phage terminase large subunit